MDIIGKNSARNINLKFMKNCLYFKLFGVFLKTNFLTCFSQSIFIYYLMLSR